MMKKVLPLAGVIAVPVLLAVAGGALTSDDAPPNVSSEPAVTDRELPPAPRAGDAGDDGGDAGDDSGDDSGRDSGVGAGGSDSGADGAGGSGNAGGAGGSGGGNGAGGSSGGGAALAPAPAPNLNYQPAPNYGGGDDWEDDWDDDWDDGSDDWDDD